MNDSLVTIEYRGKLFSVPANIPLRKAFKILNMNSGSILAICEGDLLTEDIIIKAGKTIKLINVISGG